MANRRRSPGLCSRSSFEFPQHIKEFGKLEGFAAAKRDGTNAMRGAILNKWDEAPGTPRRAAFWSAMIVAERTALLAGIGQLNGNSFKHATFDSVNDLAV